MKLSALGWSTNGSCLRRAVGTAEGSEDAFVNSPRVGSCVACKHKFVRVWWREGWWSEPRAEAPCRQSLATPCTKPASIHVASPPKPEHAAPVRYHAALPQAAQAAVNSPSHQNHAVLPAQSGISTATGQTPAQLGTSARAAQTPTQIGTAGTAAPAPALSIPQLRRHKRLYLLHQ